MSIVLGYRRADFSGRDKQMVKGCNVYIGDEIVHDGTGLAVERLYISDNRASSMGVNLESLVGKNVTVLYDRRGRVASINYND